MCLVCECETDTPEGQNWFTRQSSIVSIIDCLRYSEMSAAAAEVIDHCSIIHHVTSS